MTVGRNSKIRHRLFFSATFAYMGFMGVLFLHQFGIGFMHRNISSAEFSFCNLIRGFV